jgi:GNAT superfamily N-acetyltransferase
MKNMLINPGIKTSILDTELTDRLRDLVNPIINSSHARAMAEHCIDENSRHFIEVYSTPEGHYGVLDTGVDPQFQRRGVARLLLEDGLKLAERQGLPVRLYATPAGVPLYKSLGFRNVGQWTWRPKQEVPWEIMQWNPVNRSS